jgi:hypothetical protein
VSAKKSTNVGANIVAGNKTTWKKEVVKHARHWRVLSPAIGLALRRLLYSIHETIDVYVVLHCEMCPSTQAGIRDDLQIGRKRHKLDPSSLCTYVHMYVHVKHMRYHGNSTSLAINLSVYMRVQKKRCSGQNWSM